MAHMFESFFATLGTLVANKKVVGSWLLLLSVATAQIGEKVFIDRTRELAIVETKVDNIKESLGKIEEQLKSNSDKLDQLLEDNITVKAELNAHREVAAKRK